MYYLYQQIALVSFLQHHQEHMNRNQILAIPDGKISAYKDLQLLSN